MTAQRLTGIVCTSLTALVIVQYSLMGLFDAFTWFCVGVLFVFVASIVWEHVGLKLFQVSTLFTIGAVLQFHGESSAYFGLGIIAITCYHCFGYGFLDTKPVMKASLGAVILVFLLSATPYGSIRTTIMRSAAAATMVLMAWIPGWEREKVVRALLKKTVIAGVVLVEEIKNKETIDECKG